MEDVDFDTKVKKARQDVKTARDNLRKRKAYWLLAPVERMSWATKLVLVFIFCTSGDLAPAARYYDIWSRTQIMSHRVDEAPLSVEIIQTWMIGAFHSQKYLDAEASMNTHIAFVSYKFLAEWAAHRWLLEQNVRGIPVLSQELFHVYRNALPAAPANSKLARAKALVHKKHQEYWRHMFRLRWVVDYRVMKERVHRPLDVQGRQVLLHS